MVRKRGNMWKLTVEIIMQNEENEYEQHLFKDIKLLMYMAERYAERHCLVQIEWEEESEVQ